MIKRIIIFSLFGLLVVALLLFMAGIRENNFNDESLNVFLKSLTNRYKNWNFKIPNIPKIPIKNIVEKSLKNNILQMLIQQYLALLVIINFLITVLNVAVMILNVLISIVGFIISFVGAVKDWLSVLGVRSAVVLT